MAIAKFVPYTAEQSQEIINRYLNNESVESIAEIIGRSPRSIIAKLVREGTYISRTKSNIARPTKAALVENIAKILDLDITTIETLEKATHEALYAVNEALVATLPL